jgi:hypothetical protein
LASWLERKVRDSYGTSGQVETPNGAKQQEAHRTPHGKRAGHLLLHYKVEFTMQDKKSYRQLEAEAHAFASEFLLPESQFRTDCSE